jgi:hypothetical protein
MNKSLIRLAERRAFLMEESARQRDALSQEAVPWRIVLERADEGIAVVRYVKSNPAILISAGTILLAAVGPGRILRMLGRGVLAWRIAYRFRIM